MRRFLPPASSLMCQKVRDIFPLPHLQGLGASDYLTRDVCRKVKRRHLIHYHHFEEVNRTVSALNLGLRWDGDGQQKVNDFVTHQLLPPEEARLKLEACGVRAPYSDPVLRHRAESSSSTAVWSSASHVAHVHAIPTAERSLAYMCWGHQSNAGEVLICSGRSCYTPDRGWDPVEDTGVRRIPPVRSGLSLWHWRMFGALQTEQTPGLLTHSNSQLSDLGAAEKDLKLTAIGRLHP